MGNERNTLYEFDDFVLNASERNLWRDDELVPLPPKVFDTLCLLVENHGSVLTKEEMLDTIWEGTFVEENNLSQNISSLRKTLGKEKGFIETVPRKGYRFVAPVRSVSLEHSESIGTDGNGYIVATQTRSNVIEESVIEHEVQDREQPISGTAVKSKQRLLLGFGVSLVLATIFGFVWYLFSSGLALESPGPGTSFEYIELTDEGEVGSSSISPDGKYIAFKRENLKLMDLESRNAVALELDRDIKIGYVHFSPDNKSIYFRTQGNLLQFENVYRISKFGGEPELIARDVWGRFDISPDNSRIVYYARDQAETKHKIVIKEIETDKETVVLERPAAKGFFVGPSPVFSPNAKELAYIPFGIPDSHTRLAILDLDSKKEALIETDFRNIRQVRWHPNGQSFYLIASQRGKQYQIWNLSYPDGAITRVTSDSNAYRSLSVSSDGKIAARRLSLYANIWNYPNGDASRAEQLTNGENEIGGVVTIQTIRSGEVLFSARRNSTDGIWALNIETGNERRLTEKDIGVLQQFAYSKKNNEIFYQYEKAIWKMNLDGSGSRKINLGNGDSYSQPALSPDDEWLYYVKRINKTAEIWRRALTDNRAELVYVAKDFSPETFLRMSPDGRFLAFNYVVPKKIGDDTTVSRNIRKFGFLDLKKKNVKVVEVPSHNTMLSWTNGGRSFDFPRLVENGTAVYRKTLLDDSPAKEVVRVNNKMIYRFDWSRDERNLLMSTGELSTNLVLLRNGKNQQQN